MGETSEPPRAASKRGDRTAKELGGDAPSRAAEEGAMPRVFALMARTCAFVCTSVSMPCPMLLMH
eukprot:1896686-Alexandrium_andersonii.AAC.1